MTKIDAEAFNSMVMNLINKLQTENNIIKIENKVLRQYIEENNLSIPHEKIVSAIPDQS